MAAAGFAGPSRDRHDVDALQKSYHNDDMVDVVVFSAPQLSLFEFRDLARFVPAGSSPSRCLP